MLERFRKQVAPKRLRVLFVDDEPGVLQVWRLDFEGVFDADFASSSNQAIELLRAAVDRGAPFDVLVADQRMPTITGNQLCVLARRISPQTAPLVVTALPTDQVLDACSCTVVDKLQRREQFEAAIRNAHAGLDDAELRRRLDRAERARQDARRELNSAAAALRSWRPAR